MTVAMMLCCNEGGVLPGGPRTSWSLRCVGRSPASAALWRPLPLPGTMKKTILQEGRVEVRPSGSFGGLCGSCGSCLGDLGCAPEASMPG
eukprot:1857062-Pyramimonas_sp.AAC.1